MSEPTSGSQKPEPDPQVEGGRGQSENPDQRQEQASGSVFSDPTAPVWADPTAPIPAAPSASTQDDPPLPPVPPAPPGGAYPPFGEQPPPPAQSPPPAPPMSNPYAQQPPAPPQPGPYGQYQPGQPYPTAGQQYPVYGQSPYATGSPSNTSAVILTIVSAVSMLGTFFLVGLPSLVLGIMALSSNSTDPAGSRKKSRTGWIIYAVNAGLAVLIVILGVIALVISSTSTSIPDSGF